MDILEASSCQKLSFIKMYLSYCVTRVNNKYVSDCINHSPGRSISQSAVEFRQVVGHGLASSSHHCTRVSANKRRFKPF